METLSSPVPVFNPQEPIPGYHLQERIGSGGFGEVWRAEAPGGLLKAVKIVYGPLNASKAERELKALHRVRQVHHPLLLSLERIEIVDGHLVIVTELAEGSLMDRFQQQLQQQRPGIGRDELLAYMRDAAEALDYLYDHHQLQHLDVKPENLLLLADRIKVADFGMVKHLQENCDTMVGGLTPLYAPPEIYDSKPSRNSDQYSLAIVYQQMLTNELPFSGRTAAQLAAQHMRSPPNLAPLPDSDRAVIGRALSKDPRRRFPSCRMMVEALQEAPQSGSSARSRRTRSDTAGRGCATTLRRAEQSGSTTISVAATYPCPTEVHMLPAGPLPAPGSVVPTLFVGVGATASHVLQLLKRRVIHRLAPVEQVPAVRFLLLDTDPSTLAEATRGEQGAALRLNETLAMPLRDAGYYRGKSNALLEWLHRRWLYNIPRSLRTEGIRSLGRLAFVDHFAAVREALEQAIADVVAPEARRQSSQQTKLAFTEQGVRVVLLGSAAGGTGGGVLLDLAYAIRQLLGEAELPDDRLYGVVTLGSRAGARSRDLQQANTVACLRELAYYSTRDRHYPGEPDCDIAPFTARSAPFAQTYLAHLGDDLPPRQYEIQIGMLADYLLASMLDTASPAFEAVRSAERYATAARGQTCVRTFSFAHIGAGHERAQQASEYFCRQLVRRWAGVDTGAPTPKQEIESLAARFAEGLELTTPALESRARQLMGPQHDPQHVAFLTALLRHAEAQVGPRPALSDWVEALDTALLAPADDPRREQPPSQVAAVARQLEHDARTRSEAVREWLMMLSRQPTLQLRGAAWAIRWLKEHLGQVEVQLGQRAEQLEGLPAELRDLRELARRRWQRHTLRQLMAYVASIVAQLQDCEQHVNSVSRRVDEFSQEFAADGLEMAGSSEEELLLRRRWQLLDQLDQAVHRGPLQEFGGLLGLSGAGGAVWQQLASSMRQLAIRLISDVLARQKVQQLAQAGQVEAADGNREIAEWMRAARPRLHECGGKERLFVLVPQHNQDASAALASLLQETEFRQAALLPSNDEQVGVAYEMQDVPLENVLAGIAGGRRELVDLAGRLHTRKDVIWD